MTVFENLRLAAQASRFRLQPFWRPVTGFRALSEAAHAMLSFIGLDDRRDIVAEQLSHGDQRALEVGITYKLFNPDGQPIRAVVRVKFQGSIEEEKRARVENRSSPDLTHRRRVGPGDTLPFMCYAVYGDPRHYLYVAAFNRFDDFRRLTVGQEVVFPPLAPQAVRR